MVKHKPFAAWSRGACALALGATLLLVSPGAGAEGLYLSLGVGAVGRNDLVDYDNKSVHNTPIGRAELSYRVDVNPYISLNTTMQHISSLQADDGGMNWAGVELGLRF